MKYSGIIFDFNGVLLWDTLFQEEAWNTMAQKLRGKTMTIEEMNRMVHGRPNRISLEYLLDRKLSQIESDKLTQEKESTYRKLCLDRPNDFKLSEGAGEWSITKHSKLKYYQCLFATSMREKWKNKEMP